MRRYLAPAFVTTVSLGVLGCGKTGATSGGPEPTVHGNPPPPPQTKKRTRTAPAKIDWTYENGAPRPNPTTRKVLNPKDGKGREIYAETTDFCTVHVERDDKKPLAPGMEWWKNEYVDCSAELDDPAWDHCPERLVVSDDAKCFCEPLSGNPPPPPRVVDCPASAKKGN